MDAATLAEAIHANFILALERVTSRGPGARTARAGPFFLLDSGVDDPALNLALVVPGVEPSEARVEDVEAWFARYARPFRFVLRDSADAALWRALLDRGYRPAGEATVLALQHAPAEVPAPAVRVERVTGVGGIEAFVAAGEGDDGAADARLAQDALAQEGVALFVARLRGRPAGRALLLATGAVAGVYSVYVPGRYRGKGLGRALAAAVARAALADGASVVALQTPDTMSPLYSPIGFAPTGTLRYFDSTEHAVEPR